MMEMMMNDYIWTDGAELYHHGIKGQKWGQRNYQYEDGTLTPAGEARYLKGMKKIARLEKKEQRMRNKDNSRLLNKAARLNAKSAKYNLKVAKAVRRGNQRKIGKFSMKAARYAKRAARINYKVAKAKMLADKYAARGQKVAVKLQKEFANVPVSELNRLMA